MESIDRLLRKVIRETKVVPKGLDEAILEVAREVWDDVDAGTVRIGGFRNGLLRVELDSHARMAEATAFHREFFRQRLNSHLGSSSKRGKEHVTKLVFHVRGTI